MKKITKKLIAFFFVLCLLFTSNIIAYSESNSEKQWLSAKDFSYGMEMYDGDVTKRCGDMKLNEKLGILKIEGSFIPNYGSGGAAPWTGCINSTYLGPLVRLVWIAEGISSIGSYAFNTEGIAHQSNKNIKKIYIPTTVKKISERALRACDIYFYGDDVEIASNAIPQGAIIHGHEGSDAEKFAKNNKIEFIPLNQDDYYTIINQKEATCTEDGYTGDKILPCMTLKESGNIVKTLGHDFGEWTITKDATHTEKGEKTRYCSRCEAYETEEIGVLGHDYESDVTAPTCTEKGYTTYTCSCGDSYVADYVDAKGHIDGEWKVTKPATYTAEGEKTLYCKECGEIIRIEVVPKLEGRVVSVSIDNVEVKYKKSVTIKPEIKTEGDIKYTVKYETSDPKIVTVDQNGNITTNHKGTAKITCTVTDEAGNIVKDTRTINVKFSFGQWLIWILLFGFLWY